MISDKEADVSRMFQHKTKTHTHQTRNKVKEAFFIHSGEQKCAHERDRHSAQDYRSSHTTPDRAPSPHKPPSYSEVRKRPESLSQKTENHGGEGATGVGGTRQAVPKAVSVHVPI